MTLLLPSSPLSVLPAYDRRPPPLQRPLIGHYWPFFAGGPCSCVPSCLAVPVCSFLPATFTPTRFPRDGRVNVAYSENDVIVITIVITIVIRASTNVTSPCIFLGAWSEVITHANTDAYFPRRINCVQEL